MAWNINSILFGNNSVYTPLTEALLPFALIFTIVYSVLLKTKILGVESDGKTPKKNFNVIISIILALSTVIPHITNTYPRDWDVITIINNALPNVALITVVIVMLLLVLGLSGKAPDFSKDSLGGGFTIFGILIIIVIFLAAAEVFQKTYMPRWLMFLYDPSFQALAVTLIVMGIIIKFITGGDEKEKDKNKTGVKDFLKDWNSFK